MIIDLLEIPRWRKEIGKMGKGLYSAINMEEHQTQIPGTQLILQALEYGIGSAGVSFFDVEKVTKLLNLSSQCLASEIIASGYPSKKMERPK